MALERDTITSTKVAFRGSKGRNVGGDILLAPFERRVSCLNNVLCACSKTQFQYYVFTNADTSIPSIVFLVTGTDVGSLSVHTL